MIIVIHYDFGKVSEIQNNFFIVVVVVFTRQRVQLTKFKITINIIFQMRAYVDRNVIVIAQNFKNYCENNITYESTEQKYLSPMRYSQMLNHN